MGNSKPGHFASALYIYAWATGSAAQGCTIEHRAQVAANNKTDRLNARKSLTSVDEYGASHLQYFLCASHK